ncbi:hypothetical protein BB558_004995 [Smittium angustum]|uniref:SH3 domain-containing protein n=1 Tax=Smittium angustum TaxID=133377 RepID=A0A2U1J1Q6_SMIAN|nr:hypothetical protein BB558_004995 [Smittium angustum]
MYYTRFKESLKEKIKEPFEINIFGLESDSNKGLVDNSSKIISNARFSTTLWSEETKNIKVLFKRAENSKNTCKSLCHILAILSKGERVLGAKKLAISKIKLDHEEVGSFKTSIETFKQNIENTGNQQTNYGASIKVELVVPLTNLIKEYNSTTKLYKREIAKSIRKQSLIKKEILKILSKKQKAQELVDIQGYELVGLEERRQEIMEEWEELWKRTCDTFQVLEESRMELIRNMLSKYSHLTTNFCIGVDNGMEKFVSVLENQNVRKDIEKIIDSCNGGSTRIPSSKGTTTKSTKKPVNHRKKIGGLFPKRNASHGKKTIPQSNFKVWTKNNKKDSENTLSNDTADQYNNQKVIENGAEQTGHYTNNLNSKHNDYARFPVYNTRSTSNSNFKINSYYNRAANEQKSNIVNVSDTINETKNIVQMPMPKIDAEPYHNFKKGEYVDQNQNKPESSATPTLQKKRLVVKNFKNLPPLTLYNTPPNYVLGNSPALFYSNDKSAAGSPHPKQNYAKNSLISNMSSIPESDIGLNNPNVPVMYVQALYDYDAEADEEITLVENCIVAVYMKRPDGWWEGQVVGYGVDKTKSKVGLFPSNFTKVLPDYQPTD